MSIDTDSLSNYYKKLKRGDVKLLAKRLNVSTRTIQYVVNGRSKNPHIAEAIQRLAKLRESERQHELSFISKINIISTNPNATAFEYYLRQELSNIELGRLAQWLQVNDQRITTLLTHPETATLLEIQRLGEILEQHPFVLITQYRLGFKTITLDDMQQIREGFQDKAA